VDVSSGQQFEEASIAVGDFNRDGHEEILLTKEAAIFLFNSDGTLFPGAWPLQSFSLIGYGPSVIGDVDGDGFPKIVTSFNDLNTAQIQVIRKDGTVSKTWRLGGANNAVPFIGITPSIGDFDQNGTTDIAVAYLLSGGSTIPGMVTVFDTHAPYNPANNDWPLVLQNERDTAILLHTTPSTLAVTLTAAANPSAAGASLTFTATLSPATGKGSVQFLDGGTPISDAIPLSNGVASFSTSTLALGTHSITARYTGDNKSAASTSPILVQTVARANSSISVTAPDDSIKAGSPATFTATIAPASATGTVTFFDGSTAISGAIAVNNGTARFAISTLSTGTHSITARYNGDANFNGSTSPAVRVKVK
jgi:hypothetical protein